MKPVVKFLLILGALTQTTLSGVAFGGEVAFSFDNSHVTVVDQEQVYRFPAIVFESQFGKKELGDVIPIPKQYKGFLVEGQKQSVAATDAPMSFETIHYGDIVYRDYYGKVYNAVANGKTYSWKSDSTKKPMQSRSPASVSKDVFLKGVTDEIKAKQVGNQIHYFDKFDRVLWVSKVD